MKRTIKKRTRNARRAFEVDTSGPLDWTPLFAAFREAFEWALDVGAALARDYPEEVAAVERVRAFMRARIAGDEAHVRIDDVVFTFGLIIGAIERDLGPLGARPPWFAPPMQLPTAAEFWEPWVPRHLANDLWLHTTHWPKA